MPISQDFTRRLALLLLLGLVSFPALGQVRKHVISLNLHNLIGGHIAPRYEYAFNEDFSFHLTAGYTPARRIPGSRLIQSVILQDPENTSIEDGGAYTKFAVTPEFRMYWSKKGAPAGFYAAIGARYARHEVTVPYSFPLNGEILETEASLRIQNIGPQLGLGVQWLISDRVALDFYLGGGVGYAPARIRVFDENLNQAAYEAVFTALAEELKYDLEPGDLPGFLSNRGINISVPLVLPIFKAGVALGIALGEGKCSLMKKSNWLLLVLILAFGSCQPDPCEEVVCLNGGTCVDGLGTCECLPGYEGDSCETFVLGNFLGSYEAAYGGCVDVAPEHRVGIEQEPGSNELRLVNLGDYACPGGTLAVLAIPSGSSIEIPEQQIDCGEIVYTFSGSGSLAGETLTLAFTVTYDADGFLRTDECAATLVKA